MTGDLSDAAEQVAALLRTTRRRLVLTESCTGGLVAAMLVGVPGISEWLCGSAVTYRDDTKHRWLGVSQAALEDPQITAVSEIVAQQMAEGVLAKTPEADLALSTTGHLGPGAPPGSDGLVFVGLAWRGASSERTAVESRVQRLQLTSPTPAVDPQRQREGRRQRQEEATQLALRNAAEWLQALR